MGFCPSPACGSQAPLSEITQTPQSSPSNSWLIEKPEAPTELSLIDLNDQERLHLFSPELNRVLGGGIVNGSLNLISGEPGIGKSTLLLHICESLSSSDKRVVYVSGEESPHQIKIRSDRIGFSGHNTFLLPETNIDLAINKIDELRPSLAIVDSIQTMYTDQVASGPGSITQVRECGLRLMRWSKGRNIPVLMVGHVTKDGNVAGPRILEHMVDTVLHLEGQAVSPYRILRSSKNRFGSATEIAVYDMTENGLEEVQDPSQAMLSQIHNQSIGTALTVIMEGTTPLLVEVQALTSPSYAPIPRRVANGIDHNRLLMLTAVSSKRAGLTLHNQDVIVNITGGFKISEPAADLAIVMAIASSLYNQPLGANVAFVGEVGLSGELRQIHQADRRISEVTRLGLSKCILPERLTNREKPKNNNNLIYCSTVNEVIARTNISR